MSGICDACAAGGNITTCELNVDKKIVHAYIGVMSYCSKYKKPEEKDSE